MADPDPTLRLPPDENDEGQADNTCVMTDAAQEQVEELEVGTTIHRYIVLRTLGRGGMGVVYLAFDPELERQVALKLLSTRNGHLTISNTAEAGARLLREAQAMAKLSHPNVLPVHDVGTYDGSVFMAVEYIEGDTLRNWATNTPRTWHEIVEVFIAAGRGLVAAHTVGLVHRDFKPHNVMIGSDSQVRVMDFGLVRKVSEVDPPRAPGPARLALAHAGSTLNVELTNTGALMGTLAYMAPEQYGAAAEVDARADQFSFCVALYECLYGVRPFPVGRTEMLEACENRRLVPPQTDRRVPSWIRKLVVRGLSLRPEDRWPSMDALLAVLSRDSRKRWQWVTAVSAAALAFAFGGTTWAQYLAEQAQMCAGGPAQLDAIWSGEPKERAKAAFLATGVSYAEDTWSRVEKLMDAYTGEWLDMHRDSCEATHVRKEQSETLMDLRMRCLQRRLWDVDGLVKTFSLADAKVVERAVEAADRLTPLTGCADAERLEAQVPPPEDPATRARVDQLWQQLASSKALGASGKTKDGLEAVQSVLEEAEAIGYGPLQAETWLQLARLRNDAFDLTARAAAMKAIGAAEASKMDEVRAHATILLVEVVAHLHVQPEQAELWGELARGILERLGDEPRLKAELLSSLSHAARMTGNIARAQELGQQQIAVMEQLGRVDSRLGTGLGLSGVAARGLGHFDEARVQLQRSADILKQTLGPRHPQLGLVLMELGRAFFDTGEYARAHAALQRALAIMEASSGESALSATVLLHDGRVFLLEGQYEPAQKYLEKALAIYLRDLPPNHPQIAYARALMGDLYGRTGSYDKAEAEIAQALASIESGAPNPRLLAEVLLPLGRARLGREDPRSALEPLERVLAILDAAGENVSSTELSDARFALGRALSESGQDPKRGHALVSRARDTWASLGKQGNLAEAEHWLRRNVPN